MPAERILVIKLGALGDVIMALGPIAAIRRHHPDAEITILTRPPFEGLLARSRLADRVIADPAPLLWQIAEIVRFRASLRRSRFDCVIDLQGSDRSRAYRALLWPNRPPTLVQPRPSREGKHRHALERHAEVLRAAGIEDIPPPDLSWLADDVREFDLPPRYLVLVPGSAPHRPEKRWPADRYAELARTYVAASIVPVIIGSSGESWLANEIVRQCPGARDLTGRTTLGHIAALGRRAIAAVGNDTGPMHILAGAGCPSLVLFSAASHPAASLPLGASVTFLQVDRLDALPVDCVLAAAADHGFGPTGPTLR